MKPLFNGLYCPRDCDRKPLNANKVSEDIAEFLANGGSIERLNIPITSMHLDYWAVLAMIGNRLERQPLELLGQYLVLENGKKLERTPLYSLVRVGEIELGAKQHMIQIARRHGPGRVWFLSEPVHFITYGGAVGGQTIGGEPHVFLRTFYGHEAQAK